METLIARVKNLPITQVELDLKYYFRTLRLKSFQLKRAQADYYEISLEQRRDFLGAPSTYHLCKTIIMENTAFDSNFASDPFYPQHIAVIVQYESRLNAEKIMKFMKDYQNSRGSQKLSRKCFHFRLADEEIAKTITGYGYNAVTPFLMQSQIPVVLSKSITELNPRYFWMGGGEVDLKLGMSVEEFINVVDPLIVETSF